MRATRNVCAVARGGRIGISALVPSAPTTAAGGHEVASDPDGERFVDFGCPTAIAREFPSAAVSRGRSPRTSTW